VPRLWKAMSKVMEECNVIDAKLQARNLLGAKPYPPGHCLIIAIDANSTIAKKCGKRKATTVVLPLPAAASVSLTVDDCVLLTLPPKPPARPPVCLPAYGGATGAVFDR